MLRVVCGELGVLAGGGRFLFLALDTTVVHSMVDSGASSSSVGLVSECVWGLFWSRPEVLVKNLNSSVRLLIMKSSFIVVPNLFFRCLCAISNALFLSMELSLLSVFLFWLIQLSMCFRTQSLIRLPVFCMIVFSCLEVSGLGVGGVMNSPMSSSLLQIDRGVVSQLLRWCFNCTPLKRHLQSWPKSGFMDLAVAISLLAV